MTFDQISADAISGSVAISGVTITPKMPWDRTRECQISAQRLLVGTNSVLDWNSLKLRLDFVGLKATQACVPPKVRGMIAASGLSQLAADRVYLDLDYDFGSAALDASLNATLNDLLMVSADVGLSYFAIDASNRGNDPVPVARLSRASVVLENQGAWEKAKVVLPPQFYDPKAASAMAGGVLT